MRASGANELPYRSGLSGSDGSDVRQGPRIVFVAYYFPPVAGVASDRATALSRHLGDLGWEPIVVTSQNGFYYHTASGEVIDTPVVRTRNVELSRVMRALYTAGASSADDGQTVRPIKTRGVGNRLRALVRDFVYIPDAQIGWVPFAARAAIGLLRGLETRSVIYSTSVPYSAHLAAMLAASRCQVPWVAEFRDPWSTARGPGHTPSRLRRRVNRAIEGWIVRTADHVVVTSEATRCDLLNAHRANPEHLSVVTNGFEPLPPREVPSAGSPMTILYAGTVATGEDTGPVLAALDAVEARTPGRFRLRVLGPSEAWLSDGQPARAWLELGGVVSPMEAREAMARASVLLLVRAHPTYRNILPGKLFEYVGARRPIVAVCPADAEMGAMLIRYADVRFVPPQDPGHLTNTVEALLAEHVNGAIQGPRVSESVTAPLQRDRQAKQLAGIFESVIAQRN